MYKCQFMSNEGILDYNDVWFDDLFFARYVASLLGAELMVYHSASDYYYPFKQYLDVAKNGSSSAYYRTKDDELELGSDE